MKKLLFILVLAMSFVAIGQSRPAEKPKKIKLTGVSWKSTPHCFTSDSIDSYSLVLDTSQNNFHWGNFISFTDSTFQTSYSAPCGNDCFTSVTGTYKYVGVNRIEVYVDHIQRSGFCSIESEDPKKIYGTYLIEQSAVGLNLTKI